MAEHMSENLQVYGKNCRVIAGSFAPDSGNAPTAVYGRGFTVAYTSTGLFTVTLTNPFKKFLGGIATLQLATAADQYVNIGSNSVVNRTVVIHVWDKSDGAVADLAADANTRINFLFFVGTN